MFSTLACRRFPILKCQISRISTSSSVYSTISAAKLVELSPTNAQPYLRLIRFDKPIGTWLLFWPGACSIGLATPAGQFIDIKTLALFGAGSLCMRSAGCIINDMWDKDLDKKVDRTKSRPLASGELSNKQATAFLAGLLGSSLAILLQLNWLTVGIGASSMALVVSYPYFKRVTFWPQAVLGLAINYGALMGYTAVMNEVTLQAFTTSLAFCFWTMFYDTIYAHQDTADDQIVGIKSTALLFGQETPKWLTGFSTAMMSSLALTGLLTEQEWPYYAGLVGVAAHLAWQIKTLDMTNGDDCGKKFRSNSLVGAFLFASIIASILVKKAKKSKD